MDEPLSVLSVVHCPRNAEYPKLCIDEFEDLEDYMKEYVRYRIAGGRMKFKESDTATSHTTPDSQG